jgi:endogenous inhibitor of DNA gyrase (YacG/DUF329 family)
LLRLDEGAAGKMPALQVEPKKWYKYSFAMKHHCPICKKTTDSATDADFPFCSERCRLLDLGAWAAEKYVVSDPIFDEEELPEADRRELREGGHKTDDTIH